MPLQLANKLNNAVNNLDRDPLAVFVQINSSGEESKFGVEPADCVQLARHVHTQCNQLRLQGLMTIGMADYHSRPENFKVSQSGRSSLALHLTVQKPRSMTTSYGQSTIPAVAAGECRLLSCAEVAVQLSCVQHCPDSDAAALHLRCLPAHSR